MLTGHLQRLILKELEAITLGGKSPVDAAGADGDSVGNSSDLIDPRPPLLPTEHHREWLSQ